MVASAPDRSRIKPFGNNTSNAFALERWGWVSFQYTVESLTVLPNPPESSSRE